MGPVESHTLVPDVSFDGGELDCGNGLLLLIRQHIDPMDRGQLLEIRSTEISVDEDLPAWCRLTGNELVTWTRSGRQRSFLVCKGPLGERAERAAGEPRPVRAGFEVVPVRSLDVLPVPAPAPAIPTLAVMGVGSWPRPRWMLEALERRLAGRLSEVEFEETARDAVRLAVAAQLRAGADVLTDGEQRRDSYASFVGMRLDNCRLVPLSDLTAMVDDPDEFRAQLEGRDVPADRVRHPVPFGPLSRGRPLAGHELAFVRELSDAPVKVALPGPYVLTRTLWLECLRERAYADRESVARDVVRILREEMHELLAGGAAMVQLDEPVLTDVTMAGSGTGKGGRGFMCGALSEAGSAPDELAFAMRLLEQVVTGLPRERLGLHVCRGNWSRDEHVALSGDYGPLLDYLSKVPVGTLFLEACTARAGSMDVLSVIPASIRLGLGMVDQKSDQIETEAEVAVRLEKALALFGEDRVLCIPDCGFATYAHAPLAAADRAEAKLRVMKRAVARVRGEESRSS